MTKCCPHVLTIWGCGIVIVVLEVGGLGDVPSANPIRDTEHRGLACGILILELQAFLCCIHIICNTATAPPYCPSPFLQDQERCQHGHQQGHYPTSMLDIGHKWFHLVAMLPLHARYLFQQLEEVPHPSPINSSTQTPSRPRKQSVCIVHGDQLHWLITCRCRKFVATAIKRMASQRTNAGYQG